MTVKETSFTLDLTREDRYPVVKFRLNDNRVQKITFRLVNNGREVDLEKEIGDQFKPVFECIFPDKTFKRDENKDNWSIRKGVGGSYFFTYFLTNKVINKSGIACYYFALETPEGLRISTPTLKMVIDCDFKEDGKPSDNYVSEFEKLKKEADRYRKTVEDLDETLKEVIAGGASITEVIEAREDKSGHIFPKLKDRLNNIETISWGTDKEIKDSRVDSDGKIHDSLKDRLNTDSNKVKKLEGIALETKSAVDELNQRTLGELVMRMFSGESIVIDCFGDSTYYGLKVGGGRVDTPPPEKLAETLKAYFKNNNIVVNNKGISGNHTTNALRTFENDIKNSKAHIVYMNYGLNDMSGANPPGANDPKINAEQYRKNLRRMVSIVRNYGKIAILESCNLQLINHVGSDNTFRMEGTQQFARTMKQVAEEMNVPFIDQQKLTSKYMSGRWNVPDSFPDGLHPSQELYIQKGLNMAIPLIHPTNDFITGETFIPAGVPNFQGTDAKHASTPSQGSKSGVFMYSQSSIRTSLVVEEPGMDVYIATTHWGDGTAKCDVLIDGKSVGVISLHDSSANHPNYLVDSEIMVIENAKPGLHYIELSNIDSSGLVGAYYVRTRKTRQKYTKVAGGGIFQKQLEVSNLVLTANSDNNEVHYMLDIPTSRFLKEVRIEMTAALDKGDGIILFTRNRKDDLKPHGGLYLYTDTGTGALKISEGHGVSGYINNQFLTTESVALQQNTYSILVSKSGECIFYLNGNQLGTYKLKDTTIGGFLGFFKNKAGTTTINSVHMN